MLIDAGTLKPRPDEVLRYMGWKKRGQGIEGYEESYHRVQEELLRLKSIIRPKYVYSSISMEEQKELFGRLFLLGGEGSGIRKFVGNCRTLYLGAATLGFEYENLLKAAGNGDPSYLLMLEACGTELVESAMDQLEEMIRLDTEAEESSRFSPGYGGWELSHQGPILDYLQAHRLGIYLNEHDLMIPRKSVTAVIKLASFSGGCRTCEKSDCEYRE